MTQGVQQPTEKPPRPPSARTGGAVIVVSRAASAAARVATDLLSGMQARFGQRLQQSLSEAIETDALRELLAGIRPVADERFQEAMERLGSTADYVTVHMRVSFLDNAVAPAAEGLRSIDRAWRLAKLVAELSEADLPSERIVSLDELVPPQDEGLLFGSVEVGSLHIKFRDVEKPARRVWTFVQVLAVACTLSGYSAKDVVHTSGTNAAGQQCEVRTGELPDESLQRLVSQMVGVLSPGSEINVEIVMPDGPRMRSDTTLPP